MLVQPYQPERRLGPLHCPSLATSIVEIVPVRTVLIEWEGHIRVVAVEVSTPFETSSVVGGGCRRSRFREPVISVKLFYVYTVAGRIDSPLVSQLEEDEGCFLASMPALSFSVLGNHCK